MNSILLTGGAGYFGQGFVAHLLKHNLCERICIYSRGEYNQSLMRATFNNDERLRFFVGDVRDLPRLTRATASCDLIIHAAALKRVEVGERDSEEMVKTNVQGAINVIQAARDATYWLGDRHVPHPRKVVFLSSDKACSPLNCYGATKLVAEKLFQSANQARGGDEPLFSICRYGNIAGSTGSVIPTWRAIQASGAIARGTDPDATRFWMSRQEAVEMVLWTAEHMRGGELVVPSLPAYKLYDLAEAMNLNATYTGLTPGEKLHEQMISGYEANEFKRRGEYWVAHSDHWAGITLPLERRTGAFSSHHAKRLTVPELRKRLGEIDG